MALDPESLVKSVLRVLTILFSLTNIAASMYIIIVNFKNKDPIEAFEGFFILLFSLVVVFTEIVHLKPIIEYFKFLIGRKGRCGFYFFIGAWIFRANKYMVLSALSNWLVSIVYMVYAFIPYDGTNRPLFEGTPVHGFFKARTDKLFGDKQQMEREEPMIQT